MSIDSFGFCITENKPFNTVRYTAIRDPRPSEDVERDCWRIWTNITENGKTVGHLLRLVHTPVELLVPTRHRELFALIRQAASASHLIDFPDRQ